MFLSLKNRLQLPATSANTAFVLCRRTKRRCPSSVRYLLTAEISNVSGSGNQDISIYYDTENLTDQLLTTITVSAFPYELAVNIINLGITNIKFVCTAAGSRTFSMDNVSITEGDTPCEVCVQTDCFSLRFKR